MAKAKKEESSTPKTPATAEKPKKPAAAKTAAAPKAAVEAKPAAAKPAAAKPAAASKAAPKKAASAKPAAAKPANSPSMPLIDTDLAASAAAAMVINRSSLGTGNATSKPESAGFRQLKESLANPSGSHLGGIIGTGPIAQKKATTHGPDRQVGHNQTFGADVNRAGVPRRTSGG